MNKRFSTLVAAFAAIATVSYAQIGDKYVHLKSSNNYLQWDKASLADSVALNTLGATKADMDSALWKANLVRVNMPGNDSIYTLTNKATQKQLSFSAKLNGADEFGTAIAAGISEFKIKHNGSGYNIIGTTTDGKLVEMAQTSGSLMVDGKTNKAGATGTVAIFTVEAADADYDVTKEDLAPVLPSFKFDFAGRDGGLFTANELIPVPVTVSGATKFRFQVVGQENSTKGTKAPQYITIDTVMVGTAASVKAASFQLDTTVTATSSAYKGALNEGLQTFTLKMDLGNDSIVMTTDSIVRFNTAGEFEVADHGAGAGFTYLVGYKSFDGSAKLVVDSIQINAPLITISKGTPVKLAGGTGVYSLQLKAKGGNPNAANNDKYLTGTSATYAEAASVYVPSTQFYVKENEDGTYSAQARDVVSATVSSGVATGSNGESLAVVAPEQPFTNQPLYAVDADKNIYTTVGGDTLVFTKLDVDMANKHIGYKYYTKEEMGYGAVKFNLASKAADDIYLTLVQDSVIAGAKGVDKAVELRLMEGADLATVGDTIYYGAQALGDTLVRVAYAMEKAYNAEGRFAYEGAVVKLTSSTNGAVNENQKRFFFAENPVGGSYKVVAANENAAKMVTMNISNLTVTYDTPTASVETYFNIEGAEAPVYAKVDAGHYNVVNGSEMLTASAGIAKMLRVGDELKAAAADSDFSLYVDSAYVNRGDDNTEYGYYIYKGAEVKNDTIVGNVLAAKGDFVANNATGDSAIFRGVTVVADTIAYTGDLDKDGKQNEYKVRDAKNTSLVGFKVVDGEGYEIVALNAKKSLAVVNGTVIFSNTVAPQVFTLGATEAPTANEDVEVSEVTVIAGNGNVTVAGAQGKKVVISNILGQTVANTVIASDNATIAAPQGVVVVAVEGEEAVKAIVK
ncbi:DUF6383 domain-containing protein [Parabacteroides johnsonii]|jgi:hypothetical protein|uniref:DUF6383 domain-containing protein n=3 Tax=Parabacteroides johnsonii TaxID=387661 RepID=UPI001C8BECDB|nr:DUF6383 domain-containing protein [Parabacteroides johnsonii]MBX9109399.1 hypothetical protein [Parabacteroides johnsonii]